MTFLINFKEDLALSVELDVTLGNNSKLIFFVILGIVVFIQNSSSFCDVFEVYLAFLLHCFKCLSKRVSPASILNLINSLKCP